jgi:transmembrane sensor
MNRPLPNPRSREEIADAAAQWILRRDRGLTAAEQDEFSQWLAADPRHGEALALHRWGWDELDRLTGLQTSLGAVPDPDLFAPPAKARARRWWWLAGASSLVAAATAVAVLFYFDGRDGGRAGAPLTVVTAEVAALAAPCERRTLEDGSLVDLNRGASVEVAFTATERRVTLVRGEANFTVAKDAARPFIVTAGSVAMRAVGTVFNVRLDSAGVEVVVAEGRVRVDLPAGPGHDEAQVLSVGQSAVIALAEVATPPRVVALTAAQLAARFAWQPRLLDFTNAPLSEIVRDFNRSNPVRLVVGEPALGALRLSATFRSDNIEGFVRLMESDFGMRAEWRSEREIVLRRAK